MGLRALDRDLLVGSGCAGLLRCALWQVSGVIHALGQFVIRP